MVFGVGFFGLLIYWISIVGVMAWIALVILQSLFVGAFGAALGARRAGERDGAGSSLGAVLWPAVLWVALVELARGNIPLGGFTWGQLAQSQTDIPHMLRTAGVAGAWGTAFVMVAINASVGECGRALARGRAGAARAALAAGAAAALILAGLALPPAAEGDRALRVALVQGNVPEHIVDPLERDLAIIRSHRHLTEELHDVDLVVWPESAIGIDPIRDPEVGEEVGAAARGAEAPMIVGGNLTRDDERYQVMAFLVSETGEIVDRYQKTHLVPFGEFVPARQIFGWIPALQQVPRDAVPGTQSRIFEVAGARVAPVISFEGDFGSLVRDRMARGADLLVVATNTSTWGRSPASEQHLAMSRVRAAENGVHVVHAAVSGISAFVAPDGRVLEQTPMWLPKVLERDIPLAQASAPYTRYGDWFAWLCAAVALAAPLYLGARRRVRSPDER